MKKLAMLLAVVAVVGVASSMAMADDKTLAALGTISKVDGDKVTMKVTGQSSETGKATEVETTYLTDTKTVVTLDGKAAKVSDLKEKMTATITYSVGKDGKPGAAPALTATKMEADSATTPAASPASQPASGLKLDRLALRDVQGLFGGQDLWLFADGRLVSQAVRFGDRASPCRRYSTRLDANGLARVSTLLADHKLFEIQIPDRAGVPDEARPEITVRLADGKERSIRKWARDKNDDFDAIYKELLSLVKSVAQGNPEYTGAYDRAWTPKPDTAPASKPVKKPIANLSSEDAILNKALAYLAKNPTDTSRYDMSKPESIQRISISGQEGWRVDWGLKNFTGEVIKGGQLVVLVWDSGKI